MNRPCFHFPRVLLATGCLCLLPALGFTAPAESEGQVEAREVALELAGSFSNDGYKIRDGHWSGRLQLNEPQRVVALEAVQKLAVTKR